MRTIALSFCALVIGGFFGGPAASAQIRQDATFQSESERLDQLVAPIALYPDSLLMQVLMAATYPLEVVEAERFARQTSGSTVTAEAVLANQSWDASVKSLVGYPDVLATMSENLDWTRDLGDAFLRDQAGLLDAVQRMRQRARDSGSLATTAEQVVTVRQDRIIVVEPASPSVVYVPCYSPVYVYGGWRHSDWYYPRLYGRWSRPGLTFSIGYGSWSGWGSWFWGRPDWRWGGSSACIDVDLYNRFNRRHGYHWSDRDLAVRDRGQYGSWHHRSEHRRGVRDSGPAVARGFEGSQRGREGARSFERAPRVQSEAPRFERNGFDQRKTFENSQRGRLQAPRVERKSFENAPKERIEAPRVERRSFDRAPRAKVEAPRVERRTFDQAPRARVEAPRVERKTFEARPAPKPKALPAPARERSSVQAPRRERLSRGAEDDRRDEKPSRRGK